MLHEEKHDARVLDKQVQEWKREIGRLADLISAAQGTSVAVVMFTPRTEGYEDVAPIILVEDVLGVSSRGWPTGVAVDVLNPGQEAAI